MTIHIIFGWWLIPLIITLAMYWWMHKQDYSGDYNFTFMYTGPAFLAVSGIAWAIYFAIMYAVSS